MRVGPAVNSLFEGEIQVKDKTRGAELRCLLTKSTFIREAKHACVFLQHVRDDERESAPPAALDQPVEQYRAQAHALEVQAHEQGKLGAALCECVGARNGEHFRLAAARSAAPDQGNPPFWINKHQLIEYVRRKSPNSAEEAHPQVVRLGPLKRSSNNGRSPASRGRKHTRRPERLMISERSTTSRSDPISGSPNRRDHPERAAARW